MHFGLHRLTVSVRGGAESPGSVPCVSTGARRRRPAWSAAAFFDLDRTLLAGSTGPVFADALRSVGVLPSVRTPVEPLLFRIFDLIGENYPTMLLTREGARAAKGWKVASVREAALAAVDTLAERVQPYVAVELAEHREAGRALVLATTTPEDWVRPLAERLGFDDVVATRYARKGPTYTGGIDGEFVWGRGKARAVREWSDRHGVDLEGSYAYSDSYYDIPLLSMVGNPTAVNPDPRLMAVAVLRRWPTRHFDLPAGVPKFGGFEPQRAVMMLARPELFPWVRFRIYGTRRLPEAGPGIVVANHRSYFDPLAIGFALAKRGRPVRFLGKKEVFDAPVVGDLAAAMGGIRVDRGTGSDAPLRAAEEALAAGDLVALMPQGTIPRGRAFYDPELRGRWGAAKLASATDAPIVPIGLWNTESVWPRSAKVPNLTNILDPPTVTVRVGKPFRPASDDPDEATAEIMDRIGALLPPEAREPYEPTAEEIARATPSGVEIEDPSAEIERRPGRD